MLGQHGQVRLAGSRGQNPFVACNFAKHPFSCFRSSLFQCSLKASRAPLTTSSARRRTSLSNHLRVVRCTRLEVAQVRRARLSTRPKRNFIVWRMIAHHLNTPRLSANANLLPCQDASRTSGHHRKLSVLGTRRAHRRSGLVLLAAIRFGTGLLDTAGRRPGRPVSRRSCGRTIREAGFVENTNVLKPF